MTYPLSYVETLLGRSLENSEMLTYNRFKHSDTHKFVVDDNGLLKAEPIKNG